MVLLMVFGVIVYFTGCKKDVAVPQNNVSGNNSSPNSTPVNLISNGSFENWDWNNYYPLDWWVGYIYNNKDTMYGYSRDVPPNGGNYSLKLLRGVSNVYKPGGVAEKRITGINGAYTYTLSLWCKDNHYYTITNRYWNIGTVYLRSGTVIQTIPLDIYLDSTMVWKKYNFTFSLSTTPSDTIILRLGEKVAIVSAGNHLLVDLVSLIKN